MMLLGVICCKLERPTAVYQGLREAWVDMKLAFFRARNGQ